MSLHRIPTVGSDFADICCTEPHRFRSWSVGAVLENLALLRDAAVRVQSGAMPQSRFDEFQKSIPFSVNDCGIWSDRELLNAWDPLKTVTVDWVHNMLQDGTFSTEAGV